MKGASVVARILKQEGVDHLFCFPTNPLIDAAAEAGIRPIMPCTERTVVGMADGYSRVNNGKRIGVCAVQLGRASKIPSGGGPDLRRLLARPGLSQRAPAVAPFQSSQL